MFILTRKIEIIILYIHIIETYTNLKYVLIHTQKKEEIFDTYLNYNKK